MGYSWNWKRSSIPYRDGTEVADIDHYAWNRCPHDLCDPTKNTGGWWHWVFKVTRKASTSSQLCWWKSGGVFVQKKQTGIEPLRAPEHHARVATVPDPYTHSHTGRTRLGCGRSPWLMARSWASAVWNRFFLLAKKAASCHGRGKFLYYAIRRSRLLRKILT